MLSTNQNLERSAPWAARRRSLRNPAPPVARSTVFGGASLVREGLPEPRPNPGPRLSERARAAMRLRQLSPRTEEAYLGWMRRYHDFHGRRDPSTLGPEHVTAFLNALAIRRRGAASTPNQAIAAGDKDRVPSRFDSGA